MFHGTNIVSGQQLHASLIWYSLSGLGKVVRRNMECAARQSNPDEVRRCTMSSADRHVGRCKERVSRRVVPSYPLCNLKPVSKWWNNSLQQAVRPLSFIDW